MGTRLNRIILVVAMLFGSMMSPAIAHAAGPDAGHEIERGHFHVDVDHDVTGAEHDEDPSSPEGSGKVLPHHHCVSSFALISPYAMPAPLADRVATFVSPLSAPMLSWKAAPPTQPPAA